MYTCPRNSSGEPYSLIVFLAVGWTMTTTLLVVSKLSSNRSTWPGNSAISLLGFHLAGISILNPSPLYDMKSVFVFGLPNTLAVKEIKKILLLTFMPLLFLLLLNSPIFFFVYVVKLIAVDRRKFYQILHKQHQLV